MGLFSDRSEEDDLGDLSLSGLTGLDDGPQESVYPLEGWGEAVRAVLRDRLVTLGVPHEWDEDGSLVVATSDEAWVERILDQVEDDLADSVDPEVPQVAYGLADWPPELRDRLFDLLDEEAVPFGVEGEELFVHEIDEARVDELVEAVLSPDVEPEASGSTAEAMGELFVAADTLAREPASPSGALELLDARRSAGDAGPPYGMDRVWWDGVLAEADELIRLLDQDPVDDEAVAAHAVRLRDGLRPFV